MGNAKTRVKSLWLTEEDIISLSIATGYSKQNVISYYKSFILDCPDGKLSKKQFKNMYRQLYPNSKSDKFCMRIFSIFDCDKDDCLNFGEFLRALKITSNGNIHDKLKCAFQIYDLNGDGHLDKKETKTIFDHIYDMVGEDKRKVRKLARSSEKKVEYIFEKFDLDRDGKLTLDEFIDGCLRDEYLSNIFKTTFLASSASYSGIMSTPSISSTDSSSNNNSPNNSNSTIITNNNKKSKIINNGVEITTLTTTTPPAIKVRSNSVNDTASTASSNMTTSDTVVVKDAETTCVVNRSSEFDSSRRSKKAAKRMMFLSHNNLAYGSTGHYDDDDNNDDNEDDDDDEDYNIPAVTSRKDFYLTAD